MKFVNITLFISREELKEAGVSGFDIARINWSTMTVDPTLMYRSDTMPPSDRITKAPELYFNYEYLPEYMQTLIKTRFGNPYEYAIKEMRAQGKTFRD